MDQSKVESALNQTVFDGHNLKILHDGFLLLHQVLVDFTAKSDSSVAQICPTSVLVQRMNKVVQADWGKVQDIFVSNPDHAHSGAPLSASDRDLPCRLLQELLYQLEGIRAGLNDKLQARLTEENEANAEVKKLQAQIFKLNEENLDLRYKTSNMTMEINTLKGSIEHLENSNKEKHDQIGQLQRDGTVQLWEKEKQRLFKTYAEREEELEGKNAGLENENKTLKEKLNDTENKYKLEKMKSDVKKSPRMTGQEAAQELELQKRHCYVMEKDLLRLDAELFQQQKYAVGIFKGLKNDHQQATERLTKGDNSVDVITLRQMERITKILRQALIAASEGVLGELKADLSESYIATDKDVTAIPTRKISTKYGSRLSPLPQRKHLSTVSTPNLKDLDPNSLSPTTAVIVTNHDGDSSSEITETRSLGEGSSTEVPVMRKTVQNDHPQLVQPETGCVNMIRVLQNFPHLRQAFVESQWEQFDKYDRNKDGSLDLAEMMSAMTSTIGQQFTSCQVREAMLEVDIDDSQTIDFFEYLKVADMIKLKEGRSEVFKSQLIQKQGKHISKTCAVM